MTSRILALQMGRAVAAVCGLFVALILASYDRAFGWAWARTAAVVVACIIGILLVVLTATIIAERAKHRACNHRRQTSRYGHVTCDACGEVIR